MGNETARERQPLGLPLIGLFGLAVLGVPRVVAHDLDLVGPLVNSILVFVPPAVWIAVVVWKRVPNPLLTLLVVGAIYGVLLGVIHQVLWTQAFAGDPPSLGGNLTGVLSPAVENVVTRGFAFLSSLVTGTVVGVITGAVAWLVSQVVPRSRRG